MRCPFCQHAESRVIDSRTAEDAVRRRRECLSCSNRFTTFERVERRILWVAKRDGTRQPFSREKLRRGLVLACRKRPVDPADIEQALNDIEQSLWTRRADEVASEAVGEAALNVLRDLDPVAYIRFASVYRAFDDIEQFMSIIQPLVGTGE